MESQNVQFRRDFWRLSNATSLLKHCKLKQVVQDCVQSFNISRDGHSTLSVGK